MRGMTRARNQAPGKLIKKMKISFADKTVSLTDPGGAAAYGNVALFDIPKGHFVLLGAVLYLKLTSVAAGVSDTFDGDFSVGRTQNADGTLSANEIEIIQATAFTAPAVSKATGVMRAISAQTNSGKTIPNSAGNLKAYLNVLIDDGSISAASDLKASGDLYICYSMF